MACVIYKDFALPMNKTGRYSVQFFSDIKGSCPVGKQVLQNIHRLT